MKSKLVAMATIWISLCIAAQEVNAELQIAEFSGSSSGNTGEFEVRAPWIMDWTVSGEPGQYDVVDIALVNAKTGSFEGVAVKSKTAGNGVRLFEQGGRFYFRVGASMMNWRIKVLQLTPEEASQYKPKARDSLLDR
jgi:hypothetical protein